MRIDPIAQWPRTRRRAAHAVPRAAAPRRLAIDPLEDRRLLSFSPWAVNHTPYLQLGNAPLVGLPGSTSDQIEILWQTRPSYVIDTLDFTINTAESVLTADGLLHVPGDPPASEPFVPQPGSTATATFTGTVRATVSPDSIELVGGTSVVALNQGGSFLPGGGDANVAFQMSLAPGGPPFITGAFRDAQFELTSTAAVLDSQGEFASDLVSVVFLDPARFDFQIGLLAPQSALLSSFGNLANQAVDPGSITLVGDQWRLVIPIDGTSEFEDPGGSGISASYRIYGQLVAYAPVDQFTVDYREVGSGTWLAAPVPATIPINVGDRVNHYTTITGLDYNTAYEYRVRHWRGGEVVAEYQHAFRTRLAAGDSAPFSFVAYGDSAQDDPPEGFISVMERINQLAPDFALLLGDNAYPNGSHADFDLRLDPSINPAWAQWGASHVDYATFSNHDLETDGGQPSRDNFSSPIPVLGVTSPVGGPVGQPPEHNYSFDYGDVHFVTIETVPPFAAGKLQALLDWLAADLAASSATWKIVFTSRPLASASDHPEIHPGTTYYQQLLPVLLAGGVDLLLTGDVHNYQRSYPLLGESGGQAVYIPDPNNHYPKGAGLVQVIAGVGGASLRGDKLATLGPSFVAAGFDLSTTPAVRHGAVRVAVDGDSLLVQYVAADDGTVLDWFTIGPDVDGPWASISQPLDNGPSDLDLHQGLVTVIQPTNLQIRLYDDSGSGQIDAASVLGSTVAITRDGDPLVEGVDYTFSYSAALETITLAGDGGSFGDGTYWITLSGGIDKIRDLSGNPMAATSLRLIVDTSIRTLTFEQGAFGYQGMIDTMIQSGTSIDPVSGLPRQDTSYAGRDSLRWDSYVEGDVFYVLVRFNDLFGNLPGQIPPGAAIASAMLIYQVTEPGVTATAYELAVDWNSSVTYNTLGSQPGVQPSDYRPLAVNAAAGTLGMATVDLTHSLQEWTDDPGLNHGWLLVADGSDGVAFHSSEALLAGLRPRLIVHFVATDNLAPVSDAGGPYAVTTGGTLVLDASRSYDPDAADVLSYSWDLNDDGIFTDAFGVSPTLTWGDLLALGIAPGPASVPVRVRVSDGHGGESDSPSAVLAINLAPPSVQLVGPTLVVAGQPLSYTFVVTPAPGGPGGPYRFRVDWDGNGSIDETFVGPSGLVREHVFEETGTFVPAVWAVDADGSVSTAGVLAVSVARYRLLPDAQNPSLTNLVFGGTPGNDTIYVMPGVSSTSVTLSFAVLNGGPGNTSVTLTGVTGIVIGYGQGGSDSLLAHLLITRRVELHGGAGNDTLAGGLLNDTLYGDDGNDLVYGMFGNDVLYGGLGTDILIGDTGNGNILDGHDLLDGGDGSDVLVGNSGNDTLRGGEGEDNLYGQNGHDLLEGGDGDDFANAAQGNNTVYGGEGDDQLSAGTGNDFIDGGPGNDGIFGDEGNDTLLGGDGDDFIMGDTGRDYIAGGAGNDVLLGNEDDDTILGGDGRDILFGGHGADLLDGGTGEDLVIAAPTAFDTDFVALQAIRDEWFSDNPCAGCGCGSPCPLAQAYAQRIAHLTGTEGGLNGGYYFTAGVTVINDGQADTLVGGDGLDWFLLSLGDDLLVDLEEDEQMLPL